MKSYARSTHRKTGHKIILGIVSAGFVLLCCCAGIGACSAPDTPTPGVPSGPPSSPSVKETEKFSQSPIPSAEEVEEPVIEVYYANCAEVRAAGKAPLRMGEPGYRRGLDRDHDGTACDR